MSPSQADLIARLEKAQLFLLGDARGFEDVGDQVWFPQFMDAAAAVGEALAALTTPAPPDGLDSSRGRPAQKDTKVTG